MSKDFCLIKENSQTNNQYIVSQKLKICIKIKPKGYVPKSGLLLANYLNQIDLYNKAVLDVGCGETGILAHCALAAGAHPVVGVDIDSGVIAYVQNTSPKSTEICWLVSDLYSNIGDSLFDIILSNPPQMPMPAEERNLLKDWHDSPGDTGQEILIKIIQTSLAYLKNNGKLLILIMDFLGVTKSFNESPSLKMVGHEYGLSCTVRKTYCQFVRKGGKTEQSIPWIMKTYPKYRFKKNKNGEYLYNIAIVEFSKQ